MDKVSVIVPVHNRSSTVARALDSILVQTWGDWEAIVVDDGSADDSAAVVEGYVRMDSRFSLIQHEQAKGAQAARNTGIRAAKGDWIAFLDSDDEWLPTSVEARVRLAIDKRPDVVHCDCYVAEAGEDERRRFGVPPVAGAVYKELLTRPGPMFQGLLVSKSALEQIGLLDEEIVAYQEWDTSIRLAEFYDFEFIDEPLFIYHLHEGATISKNSARAVEGYLQVVRKHAAAIEKLCGIKVLAAHYKIAASLAYDGGDVRLAKKLFSAASTLHPFDLTILARRLLLSVNSRLYDRVMKVYAGSKTVSPPGKSTGSF